MTRNHWFLIIFESVCVCVFVHKDFHLKLHIFNDFDEKRHDFSVGGWGSFEASNLYFLRIFYTLLISEDV